MPAPKDVTCPGTAYIAAVLGGPGVMKHTSKFATMRTGRMDGKPDAKLNAFVEAAKAANIDIQPQDDMNRERWQKFIFLSSMAGVNCMMREPIGKVLADPDTRAFYKKLMQECLAVGQKSGAKVPDSWIDDRMTFSELKNRLLMTVISASLPSMTWTVTVPFVIVCWGNVTLTV